MGKKRTKSSRPLWMPLFVGDYLSDTRRLTIEQHGAYLLILMDYWQSGAPPDNNDTLARIVGASRAQWMYIRPALEPFFSIDGNVWRHARLERELSNSMRLLESARSNGSRGGRPPRNPPVNPPVNPRGNPRGNLLTIDQEQEQKQEHSRPPCHDETGGAQ